MWPNGWMDEGGTWHGVRPQPRRLCVRWGPRPPPQKGGGTPQFSIHVYCSQTAAWIKKSLGTEVGLGPYDIVLDWDPARQFPLPKKGAEPPPHFSAHFWATVCKTVRPMLSVRCLSCLSVCMSVCDVRAPWPNGWMDHARRPWPWPHCVTWGPSSPSPKVVQPPNFRPNLLRPNGCMHQNATWYGCRPQPRGLYVR